MNIDYRTVQAQAQTLRHLPPNTPLATDQEADEQLLNELLAIDPDLNPIQWLMNAHSELCVRLLLWKHLDILRASLISKQRDIDIKKMSMIGNANQQSTFNIGYTFNKHDLSLLRPLVYTHPLTIEGERLLQVFSHLRRREMVAASNDRFNDYGWDLRNKLLSLPDDVNPLVWLRENHLQYAAMSTLQYLIKQIIPRRISVLSSPNASRFESFSPKAVCRLKGIAFVLEKITYIHDVFSIRLTFTITGSYLKTLEKKRVSMQHGHVEWSGAGNLSDNLGNRYLICYSLLNSSKDLSKPEHIYDYDLHLACYPGIMRKAKQLVLSYDDVTLIAEEILLGTTYIDTLLYSVPLEKLKWTVDIPPFRQR